MSKSALVMDTPKHCDECCVRQINLAWCQAARKSTSHHPCGKPMDERKRPDWCPLKLMPEKRKANCLSLSPLLGETFSEYNKGWNDCIDAICEKEYRYE